MRELHVGPGIGLTWMCQWQVQPDLQCYSCLWWCFLVFTHRTYCTADAALAWPGFGFTKSVADAQASWPVPWSCLEAAHFWSLYHLRYVTNLNPFTWWYPGPASYLADAQASWPVPWSCLEVLTFDLAWILHLCPRLKQLQHQQRHTTHLVHLPLVNFY